MIVAIKNSIIIKPVYQESAGNILLPQGKGVFKQYDGFIYGEVVAVGQTNKYKHLLKVGDRLLFRRHEGRPVTIGGEEYLMLRPKSKTLDWIDGVLA